MSDAYIWAVVIGMGLANYTLRLLPIAVLSRMKLPEPALRWLSFIPVSVLASLVAVEVLRPDGVWLPPLSNAYLVAAVPTALVFRRTRSFIGATVAGIVVYVVARSVMS